MINKQNARFDASAIAELYKRNAKRGLAYGLKAAVGKLEEEARLADTRVT